MVGTNSARRFEQRHQFVAVDARNITLSLALLTLGLLFAQHTEAAGWVGTGSLITSRQYNTATLLPNGKVLVAGGLNGLPFSSAELYDPVTATWATSGSLNNGRRYHTAALLPNGQVLLAGGATNLSGTSFAGVELYEPVAGIWTNTGSLMVARQLHTATLLSNGQVLAV